MNQNRLFIVATVLTGFAIALVSALILLDPIMRFIVYEQTELVPGTVTYEQWVQPTIDIYFQAYLFNLTNPIEFQAGEKPILHQLGPYTYKERRFKKDIIPQAMPSTLQYKEVKEYHFKPAMSAGLESDVVTTVSLGYLAIDTKFGWLPAVIDRMIALLEQWVGEHLIVRKTVGEILWGYEDPFLVFLRRMNVPVPSTMIGLYLGKNGTDDGPVEVYANNKDPENFGHIYKYRGSRNLLCWTTQQANQINGSDGSLFHPFMHWSEHPYVFSADICRSIQLQPDSMIDMYGVPVIRYLPYTDTFSSPLTTEKNRGFCIHWPNCLKDGVFDVSTCIPGAPIAMSPPHLQYVSCLVYFHCNDSQLMQIGFDPL
ncbi:unnamed protein product [Dicrocoelium dendriticum]|nr:unnamed protein product [Dicrocoelium dendriticum]